MDDNINYWIAGFISGEGYFGFGKSNKGYTFVEFAIVLKNNDVDTLKFIQKILNGTIFEQPSRNVFHYRIKSKKDLRNLILFCDKYMLDCHKRNQYQIWKNKIINSKYLTY